MRRIAGSALLLLLCLTTRAVATPNIVVILTDDQEDTGSIAYMPKLQELIAKQGITFTNSFVNTPACASSRVSLLTGQAAHNHGVKSNSAAKGGGWPAFKDKEDNALPVWLKAAGYKTAFLGKYVNDYGRRVEDNQKRDRRRDDAVSWSAWLRGFIDSSQAQAKAEPRVPPTPPGWDLWHAFFPAAKYFDYQVYENGKFLKFGRRPEDYSADVLKKRAQRFIREQARSAAPFFVLIAPKTPHGDKGEQGFAVPAPRHANLFASVNLPRTAAFNEDDVSDKPLWVRDSERLNAAAEDSLRRSYRTELQSLQAIDDLVEGIVATLRETGELDDTIVIFTSDNGYLYGEHRLTGKFVPYEGSIRIPLLMRGPGIPKAETRDELINNLDLVATIEQLTGVVAGIVPDGQSLTPLFADANAPWRSAILVEGGNEHNGLRRRFSAVRTMTRKYVRYGDGFEELYDLSTDPHELDNKAKTPSYAGDLAALRRTHDRLNSCAGLDCWVP